MSLAPICTCNHAPYYCNFNKHCHKIASPNYPVLPSLELPDFKKLRKECKLTLREVEKQTGISNPYLSQLENGICKEPSYKKVATLLHFYYTHLNKIKQP